MIKNYIFRLEETFSLGIDSNYLALFFFASITCGILVIVSKNPIISVLYLIGLFLSISLYLINIGLSFIGLSYLLVYVGAVSILFLFILMLINVRISELVTDNYNSVPLSIIVVLIFSTAFYDKIPFLSSVDFSYLTSFFSEETISKSNVNYVSSSSWDTAIAEVTHISSIGNILYTSYPILLIITSIILLLAMVGTIVITVK